MGRDQFPLPTVQLLPADFNSHARVGRDLISADTSQRYILDFNSHARVGRDVGDTPSSYVSWYFNSHARVGRDICTYDNTGSF